MRSYDRPNNVIFHNGINFHLRYTELASFNSFIYSLTIIQFFFLIAIYFNLLASLIINFALLPLRIHMKLNFFYSKFFKINNSIMILLLLFEVSNSFTHYNILIARNW